MTIRDTHFRRRVDTPQDGLEFRNIVIDRRGERQSHFGRVQRFQRIEFLACRVQTLIRRFAVLVRH